MPCSVAVWFLSFINMSSSRSKTGWEKHIHIA